MGFEGSVQQTSSGQWAWMIARDEIEIVGGGGYDNEDAAIAALHEVLEDLSGDHGYVVGR